MTESAWVDALGYTDKSHFFKGLIRQCAVYTMTFRRTDIFKWNINGI